MTESRFDIGMKVRKEELGSEHVERARALTTEFDADYQRLITESAWGSVWARPDLDRRTRSLVTIAILAALGREELALHLRSSRNIGVDPHEIGGTPPRGRLGRNPRGKHRVFAGKEEIRSSRTCLRSGRPCAGKSGGCMILIS